MTRFFLCFSLILFISVSSCSDNDNQSANNVVLAQESVQMKTSDSISIVKIKGGNQHYEIICNDKSVVLASIANRDGQYYLDMIPGIPGFTEITITDGCTFTTINVTVVVD